MKNYNKSVKTRKEARKSRNRKLAGFLALVLIAALILGAVLPAFVKAAETGGPEISGEVGFSRKYKLNGKTPVRITVENNGDDFNGELQIIIDNSPDKNYTRNVVYAYPFELSSGAVKDISLEIDIPVIRTSISATCVDKNGKTVSKKDLDAIALDPQNILIGALTDDKNSLSYIKQMKLNVASATPDNIVEDNLVYLDEANMPASIQILNNFNFIIINNFDTGRLTETQIKALKEWVETGGVLILGSGPNFQKVFKMLGSFIESQSVGQTRISRFSGESLDTPIVIERMEVAGSMPVLSSGGEDLISEIPFGIGTILVHSFDLGIAPIPALNRKTSFLEQAYIPHVMSTVLSKGNSSGYNYPIYYGSNIRLTDTGRIYTIFILIGVYCIGIGPVLYFILKRRDKREKAVVILPVLSLALVAVIAVISFGSSFRKPIISTNSIVVLDSGSHTGKIDTLSHVFSPSKGNVRIDFDRNMSFMPTGNNYYYGSGSYWNDYAEKKITLGDKPSLTFYNNGKWEGNQYRSLDTVVLDGGIICDLTLDGENLIGEITNTTGLDFYDVIISFANEYRKYDFLGAHSSIEIVQPFQIAAGNYNRSGISQAYRDSYNSGIDMSVSERQTMQLRQYMLDNYINMNYENRIKYGGGGYSPQAIQYFGSVMSYGYMVQSSSLSPAALSIEAQGLFDVDVYAFNYADLDSNVLLINGRKAADFNLNLFNIKAPISLNPNGYIKIPAGMIPAVIEGSGESGESGSDFDYSDPYGIYITRGGELVIRFDIPQNLEVSAFGLELDMTYNPYSILESVLLYNFKSGEWEGVYFSGNSAEQLEFRADADSDYISKDGSIKLKLDAPVNTYIRLPGFSVEGIMKG